MSRHYQRNLLWGAVLFVFLCLALVPSQTTAQQQPQQLHRLIVGVNAPFIPEGDLAGGNAVLFQRAAIANRQGLVINALRNQNLSVENLWQYQTIPYVAITVDDAGLSALQSNPNVTEIIQDIPIKVSTTSANVVVGAPTVWANGFTGAGYAVAILDTGVDFTHPSLTDKRLAEACFTINYAPDAASTACPNGLETQIGMGAAYPKLPPQCNDGCDHGTHVAGIAAGNGQGKGGSHETFRGVAPGAGLIGINVFSIFNDVEFCGGASWTPCTASYISDQIRGLEHVYSLRHTFNIASANMSLGGGYTPVVCGSGSYTTVLSNLKSVNIAVIAASGNDGYRDGMGSPACISNVISVGATNDSDAVANFSNVANFLDFFAPGVSITSAVPGGNYQTWNGTSMATPYVAGAWAIMRQAYPSANVDAITALLKTNGVLVNDTRPSTIIPPRPAGTVTNIPRIHLPNAIPPPTVIRFNTASSSQSEGQVQNIPITLVTGNGAINLPSPFTVHLNYTNVNGAIRNVDYTAPDTITFTRAGGWAPNTTYTSEAILPITLLNDDVVDPNEQVIITFGTITSPPVTPGSPNEHTLTIINTNIQATGVVNFSTSNYGGGEYDVNNVVNVPVVMTVINGTPNITQTVTVNLSYVASGGAVRNTDYTAPSSIQFVAGNFGAGTHMVPVPITILPRVGDQGGRSFTINMTVSAHPHVVLGSTTSATFTIFEGAILRMTENELRHYIMEQLQPSHSISAVIPDFYTHSGGGMNMAVILTDGTVGMVNISMISQGGVQRVVLGTMTVNGLPASAEFVATINTELPALILTAIDNFTIARTGTSQRVDIFQINESELVFYYFFVP